MTGRNRGGHKSADPGHKSTATLFTGEMQMMRYKSAEDAGGSIALVATNNTEVQAPPSNSSRIHASRQKQIAFNNGILEKEEVADIISGLSDFLNGLDLRKPTLVLLNVGERMRGTQPICGRRWGNDSRKMTATGTTLPGLSTSGESVAISGITDALTWRHVFELPESRPRPGKRVIVYPDFLDKAGLQLAARNVGPDSEEER